jgi:peptidoglycan/xylan/chitin deacetylase (PgdA/CDA1 family)
MLTFRRLTTVFFLCLLALNVISIFFCGVAGNFICDHMAAFYFWVLGLYFGLGVLMAFFPRSGFHHPAVTRGKQPGRTLALTFDDGPDRLHTPAILDVLRKHRVPAAFFCTGNRVEHHGPLLQRIDAEGHIIGNHSWNHSPLFDFYLPRYMKRDILLTTQLIASLTGKKPVLFRPPFGVINPMLSKALRETGMTAVTWSIRSFDTVRKDPSRTFERIIRKLDPGAVILLHDHSSFNPEYLEKLILRIRDLGYTIIALDVLLELKAYE